MNYISIYGFKTEDDLDKNNETHIDTLTETGNWESAVREIIDDNAHFYHINVERDNGQPLTMFD